jgi:hypothetical protein
MCSELNYPLNRMLYLPQKSTLHYIFGISCSLVADVLLCVISITVVLLFGTTTSWNQQMKEFGCQLFRILEPISISVTTSGIAFISISHRFIFFSRRQTDVQTNKYTWGLIFGIWTYSVVSSTPIFFGNK